MLVPGRVAPQVLHSSTVSFSFCLFDYLNMYSCHQKSCCLSSFMNSQIHCIMSRQFAFVFIILGRIHSSAKQGDCISSMTIKTLRVHSQTGVGEKTYSGDCTTAVLVYLYTRYHCSEQSQVIVSAHTGRTGILTA